MSPQAQRFRRWSSVRIEKDGRVSKFEIIKPSGNIAVDESVRVVAKQVTQVDPPPTGLFKGDHYDIKINFELNTDKEDGIKHDSRAGTPEMLPPRRPIRCYARISARSAGANVQLSLDDRGAG